MSKKGFTYTLQIDAEIKDLVEKTNKVKNSMQSIMDAGKAPGAEKIFSSIERAIEKLQNKASQPIESVAAFKSLQKDAAQVETSLNRLGAVIGNLGNMDVANKMDLLPPGLKKQIEEASAALKAFNKAKEQAEQKSKELLDAETELASAEKELKKAGSRVQDKKALVTAQQKLVDETHAEADAIKSKIEALKKYQATTEAYEAVGGDKRKAGGGKAELAGLNLPADRKAAALAAPDLDLKDAEAVAATIARLNEEYSQVSKTITDVESTQRRYIKQLNEANNAETVASAKVDSLNSSVEGLNKEFEDSKAKNLQSAYTALRSAAEKLGIELSDIPIDYTEQNFKELEAAMVQLTTNGIAQVSADLDGLQIKMEDTGRSAQDLGDKIVTAGDDVEKLDATVANTMALTERIKQFVGLAGGVEIARRAMGNAFSTIKDLDAAMTEMAVVTDLGVGDYWDQLPEYTARANELGVSIKSAYESATLFYQQGLKTNEVVAISNETLKMARIAGLSAEDATNKMTAALRGFNMELNETSAQRVADVYSELAAITASDVKEISSAMTKTASIAASAGMEFETTAAFLSQIIETTRESAETAGTAMKTVIARFQELKKDPSEIGEVDGEIVDANKIETALRSVGVALRDTRGQFRELDDVFLELSSKWDGLDTNTQRYIATIAAGSRQQSRFIAMMSDYSRTQELVAAANNSVGASNKQFEKTMDSLQSKLNELKNAWDSFTMGIMDSEVVKAGVSILTAFITAINSLTDAFGDFSGAAKIGLLVLALYLGDKALNTFMTSLKSGSSVLQAFGEVGRKSINQLKLGFAGLSKQIKKMSGQKVGVDIAPATAAMKNYTKATQNQVTALKLRQTIENNTALTAEAKATKLAALDKIQIANEKRKTAAIAEYAVAQGLTLEQANVAISLETAGVAPKLAQAAALGGLTLAKMADYEASMIAAGLDKEEIARRKTLIVQTYAQVGAEKVENAQKKTGIALLWAKAKAQFVETANTWAQWIAQKILNDETQKGLALTLAYIGLVLSIIAVIGILVGLVWLVVKAFKTWKANQPDAQLEALEEKAEKAKETAEETKKAYEDLIAAQEEYNNLDTNVDDLTEGTTAWKEAVAELNEQILELITLYPQLVAFLEIAENGRMSIKQAGWDQLIENQQKQAAIAQAQVFKAESERVAKVAEIEGHKTKSTEIFYTDSNGNLVSRDEATWLEGRNGRQVRQMKTGYFQRTVTNGEFLDYDVGGNNQAELRRISNLTWGTQEYNEAMLALRESIGATNIEQQEALNKFDETAKRLAELEQQQKSYEKQMLRSLGSATAQASENYSRIVDSLADEYDAIQEAADEKSETKWKRRGGMWENGNDKPNDELIKELDKYGLDSSDSEKKDMAALLAAKGGRAYTEDEIKDMRKKADGNLAKELEDIDSTIAIGEDYVNKLYQMQEENATLGDLYSGSLDIDLASAEDQIKELKGVDKTIIDALNNRVNTVKQARKDIDLELQKIYKDEALTAEAFAGSYDQAQEFYREYSEILSGVGEAMAISFSDMFKAFDVEQQREYLSSFGDVNWASAIDGAAALKEMLQSTNEAVQEFAAKTILLEDTTYSATAQMNEFYKSLSAEALDELAEDGKITAVEMLELAKTNKKLAKMMDTTGVSAATLANYYELLESGAISAYEATNEFIIALDKLNAASNAIENAFGFIDTFEPSRSQTEISEYFAEMRESAMSLYDIGAYGDQQLKDYINAFLGDSNWQAIIDKNNGDMQAAIDEAMAQINSYGENLYGTWQTLVKQGLQGVSMGEDGSIQFDMTQIGDLDQLKQQIMDMGWSETMADALLADAQTFSVELTNGLDQLGISAAFESWLSGALSINGKTIIPKSQVEAMAKELHTTVEKLTEDLKAEGIEVSEIITSDGFLSKDMREQLIADAEAAGEFDLETNYQLLLELGLDDATAKAELKAMANSLTDVPFTMNGDTVKDASGVIYDSTGVAIEGGSTEGLIDSLEDPRVEAAQQLSALEQGEMMAKANATGSIVATKLALETTAKGFDMLLNPVVGLYNGIAGALGWEKIGFSGIADNMDVAALTSQANSQIEGLNAAQAEALTKTINTKVTGKSDATDAVANLTDKYTEDLATTIEAYNSKKAQEAGVVQEETDTWENPYDELYNLNHKLNAAIREREKLERDYERAVEDSSKSAQDLADITAQEFASLKEEAKVQKDIAQAALKNIETKRAENTQYSQYYTYDEKTNTIQVDWEAVDKTGWSADEGAEFKEFISYLEEQADTAKEAQDALEDIEDDTAAIKKRGRDATSEIYNQVKEGLIKERQEQIDHLQSINDSIQEAQDALVDQMQRQIDEARQDRDNAKTEQDISDKETRLAYLMRNSSGSNAMEIAQLQKEIADEKQGYTDTLVDQQLQKLQDVNEKAAEQRQRQIDLAQEQLDSYSNSEEIWTEVQRIVDEGFKQVMENNTSFADTEAGKLMASANDFASMNPIDKQKYLDELNALGKEGALFSMIIAATDSTLTSVLDDLKELFDSIKNPSSENSTTENAADVETTPTIVVTPTVKVEPSPVTVVATVEAPIVNVDVNVEVGTSESEEVPKLEAKQGIIKPNVFKVEAVPLTEYATGGLADFTGPAWLDGTKSKPEIVLNQTDSENFIALRDILADILNGTTDIGKSNGSTKGGDNYYDIEISVDHLADDYDVEQLADKIRDMIYEDSTYRNVNSISGLR